MLALPLTYLGESELVQAGHMFNVEAIADILGCISVGNTLRIQFFFDDVEPHQKQGPLDPPWGVKALGSTFKEKVVWISVLEKMETFGCLEKNVSLYGQ